MDRDKVGNRYARKVMVLEGSNNDIVGKQGWIYTEFLVEADEDD